VKAAVRFEYGLGDVLSVREIEKPVPRDDELLIRVHAATVNRTDCHVLAGKPFPMRLFTGLLKPRAHVIGTDFAGRIEAVGSTVGTFRAGERVMGFGGIFGAATLAQYLVLPETKAVKGTIAIPDDLDYEVAAACPEGTFYAASGLIQLKPQTGQNAMVYGATGAIGSAYVQLLKYYGVQVTAVCRGENAALVRSLGADRVIDYEKEDFTKDGERYDFVFDAVGKSNFLACKTLLKADGRYTSSGGAENIFFALVTPLLGGKRVPFIPPKNVASTLRFILDLIEKGSFKPLIDRTYRLDEIAEAFTYVASGQKLGNVIVTMDA
jgi:NADPH:quinone reductase-like Zn-dependent oxidoreductase